MNNENEFNELKGNNAQQLTPKPYYTSNNIGSSANKVDTQKEASSINTETESEEKASKSKKTSEQSTSIAKLVTKFVAIMSAAVVGTTTLSGIFAPTTTLVAQFEDVYATQNEISYYVYIEDTALKDKQGRDEEWESLEDKNVYLYLENDFTKRSEKLFDYYVEGTFEGLQENMEYTISVKVGDYVIGSKTIRTASDRQSTNSDDGQYKPTDPDHYDPDDEPTTSDDPTNDDPITEPTNEDPTNDDPTNDDLGSDDPTGGNTNGQTTGGDSPTGSNG